MSSKRDLSRALYSTVTTADEEDPRPPLPPPATAPAVIPQRLRSNRSCLKTGFANTAALALGIVALVLLARTSRPTNAPRQQPARPLDLVSAQERKPCSAVEKDVDFHGLRVLRQLEKVHDSSACEQACHADEDCVAWTWGRLHAITGFSNQCVLKASLEDKTALKFRRFGVISGILPGVDCNA